MNDTDAFQDGALASQAVRLGRIASIIEGVDNRCMAADGPVTPTLQEMTQAEISEIYRLATMPHDGRGSSAASGSGNGVRGCGADPRALPGNDGVGRMSEQGKDAERLAPKNDREADRMDASEAFALVEWDWVQTPARTGALHHLATAPDLCAMEVIRSTEGETTCGKVGTFVIPGLFSRMGANRCRKCCDRLGIARGVGSPKNDPSVRPWVEARLRLTPKSQEPTSEASEPAPKAAHTDQGAR